MFVVRQRVTAAWIAVLVSSGGCSVPDDDGTGIEPATSDRAGSDGPEVMALTTTSTSTLLDVSTDTAFDAGSNVESSTGEAVSAADPANVCATGECECSIGDVRRCSEGGYAGPCAGGLQTCNLNGTWSTRCSIMPRAQDTCEPGNDDDCDGIPNGGCSCTAGETRSCVEDGYGGPCAEGVQTCSPDGAWGDCSIAPRERDGCAWGNNDDCRGAPNEGCLCIEDVTTRECGMCGDGVQTCIDGFTGQYGRCEGGTTQNVYFQDLDGDGFGSDITIQVCGEPHLAFSPVGGDCDDSNSDAFPGQEEYFIEPRSDGTHDYDCDGAITRQFNVGDYIGVSGCAGESGVCDPTGSMYLEELVECGSSFVAMGCAYLVTSCRMMSQGVPQRCR